MKKLILALSVVAFFNYSVAQDFKGKITYEASMIPDESPVLTSKILTSKDIKMPESLKELEVKSGSDAVPINFELLFNGNESLYKSELDMEETKKLGLMMNQTNLVGRQSQTFYTNVEKEEKYFQSLWTNHILVNLDDIAWDFTKETKKIGEYTAYKATAVIVSEQTYGRNHLSPVVAWYTPEVELPFGIQNFVGLPGLTLELTVHYEEGIIRYSATQIELDSSEEIDIIKPVGKKSISEKEYVEMIKKLNANRFSQG